MPPDHAQKDTREAARKRMPDLTQRWLSLAGLCTVLNLTPSQVKTLYRQKLLVRIGKGGNQFSPYRYLDPTPEYAERLRLAAVMLSKNSVVPISLPLAFLLTKREVAELMGWSLKHAELYLRENKVPRYKAKNRLVFYSVSAVRDLIWKRTGRKKAGHVAPLLLTELITFTQRFVDAETALMPTDEQFKEDEALQKKLAWMMRQPQRDVMLADFLGKMELAKRVLSATAGPGESGTRR